MLVAFRDGENYFSHIPFIAKKTKQTKSEIASSA